MKIQEYNLEVTGSGVTNEMVQKLNHLSKELGWNILQFSTQERKINISIFSDNAIYEINKAIINEVISKEQADHIYSSCSEIYNKVCNIITGVAA